MQTGWFVADRGLKLAEPKNCIKKRIGQRLAAGMRETVESIRQVYFILFRLISGQMSATNLGGPGLSLPWPGWRPMRGFPDYWFS